ARAMPWLSRAGGTVALVFMSPGGEGKGQTLTAQRAAIDEYKIGQIFREGLKAYIKQKENEESIVLYRGVSKEIDVPILYAAAKRGFAVPRGFLPNSAKPHDNKNAHTGGDNNSIYTSWTIYKSEAEKFA